MMLRALMSLLKVTPFLCILFLEENRNKFLVVKNFLTRFIRD
jgi:hypothetical protein